MNARIFQLTSLFCFLSFAGDAQIVINEFLASNQIDIVDEMLQTADWIELYNASSSPVDVGGYYLSDDETNITLFQIPTGQSAITTIPAMGHLIIWADNDPLDGPLHANFRLSSNGETIILTAPNGQTILDMITYPLQQTDISYGREMDGSSTWVFFNNTTPGATNQEVAPPVSFVFVNEVMAFNLNNITDGAEEHEGWIEIYNPNDVQVNLANYYIGTPGNPTAFQIPTDNPALTTVDAGGFLLFWMDAEPQQAQNHVNFELNLGGGTVVLTAPNGSTTVNSYVYPAATLNTSWGRISDGGLGSQEFVIPTPRVTNALVIIEPEELYINEILAANQNDITDEFGELDDWIEIYNPNPYPVNIGGYFLTDNPENPQKFMVPDDVPDQTTIPAQSWFLLWADEDGLQGPTHISFRLNNQGEDLRLYGPDGFTLADRIVFGYIAPDFSYGRFTDGGTPWVTFTETTPDASNNGAVVGVEEETPTASFKIYPNPGNGLFTISENTVVWVYNSVGALVFTSFQRSAQLDLSALPAGVYLIKSEEGSTTRVSLIH